MSRTSFSPAISTDEREKRQREHTTLGAADPALREQFQSLNDSTTVQERLDQFKKDHPAPKDEETSELTPAQRKLLEQVPNILLMGKENPKQTSPLAPITYGPAPSEARKDEMHQMVRQMLATDAATSGKDGIHITLGENSLAKDIFMERNGSELLIKMNLTSAGQQTLQSMPSDKVQQIIEQNLKQHLCTQDFAKARIQLSQEGGQSDSDKRSEGLDMLEVYFDSVKESHE